jgi:hypothetical protein
MPLVQSVACFACTGEKTAASQTKDTVWEGVNELNEKGCQLARSNTLMNVDDTPENPGPMAAPYASLTGSAAPMAGKSVPSFRKRQALFARGRRMLIVLDPASLGFRRQRQQHR